MLAATLIGCGETTDVVGTRSSSTMVETPTDDVLDTIGMTPEESEVAIRSAYEQLFFGDPATQAVYRPVGDDAGYIEDVQHGDVRTDAIGYGMFVTVQLREQEVFDKLWTWAKRYMLETEPPREGMLRWSCSTEGTDCEPSAASDATSVIATSLFLAEATWADTGSHDYASDANMVVDAMVLTEERNGGMVGGVRNLFDVEAKLPRNTSSVSDGSPLVTAYLMPGFYDYWSTWRAEDAEFWSDAAEASRDLLRLAPAPITGLIPRAIAGDGTPATGEDYYDETAARTLLNRWFCHAWQPPQSWVSVQSRTLLDFLLQQDKLVSSYELDGTVIGDRNTVAHISLTATAAAASDDVETYASFLQLLADASIPEGEQRYYQGMLYLISLLAVSGNIRAGAPAP
jgi:oligosaccharide reducing-end xylanase